MNISSSYPGLQYLIFIQTFVENTVRVKSDFSTVLAIVCLYDHFYVCQDTHSEHRFAHYLSYLCQKFKRKKDRLLLSTEVKDNSAVWIGNVSRSTSYYTALSSLGALCHHISRE